MTSIYEKSKSRLVKDLSTKRAEREKKHSKLLVDLEIKRKKKLTFSVSQLVADLSNKKAKEEMFLKAWKEADENSRGEIEALILKVLGHPLEISKLVLDLEKRTVEEANNLTTKIT